MISLDGFGAGSDQDIDHPMGVGGNLLHGWEIPTRTVGYGRRYDFLFCDRRHHCLIDEVHTAISPVLFGSGERLFEGIDLSTLGYTCIKHQALERATHVVLARK